MTTCATWVTLCPTEVQVGVRVAILYTEPWPWWNLFAGLGLVRALHQT